MINNKQVSKKEKEERKERLREGAKLYPKTIAYRLKVLRSGDHVEVFQYDTRARATCVPPKARHGNPFRYSRSAEAVIGKGQAALKRLINANVNRSEQEDKFITLTYAESMEDVNRANKDFENFIKRLRYRYPGKWEYVGVPEIQRKRYEKYGVKVIHYHVATFGLPYIPQRQLMKIWGKGIVSVERQRDYENPGAYMAKYIGKDFAEDEFKGNRRYFTSQGLVRATQGKAETLQEVMEGYGLTEEMLTYESEYRNNPFIGWIHYRHYDLRKGDKSLEKSGKPRLSNVLLA